MLSPAGTVGGRRGIKSELGVKLLYDGRKSPKLCGVAANVVKLMAAALMVK